MPAAPVVCCDLDGVVWLGDEPIAGGDEAVAMLRDAGVRVLFVTNNSGLTRSDYIAKLGRCGIAADASDIVSSAMAAARWCTLALPGGARVFACAGNGVREALGEAGFVAVDDGPAAAVVVGWHREFDYDRLTRAADAARAPGTQLVATNTDPTYPGPRGSLLPGAGSLVAAVATASGRTPIVVGKPHETLAQLVVELCGPNGVMIGDRATTDGAFAAALGWPFAFVRSGVQGDEATEPPALVADDLRALVPQLLKSGLVAVRP